MEKPVVCTKCSQRFKATGPTSKVKEKIHSITCPYCGEKNDVLWPMDASITAEKWGQ